MPTTKHWTTEPDAEHNVKVEPLKRYAFPRSQRSYIASYLPLPQPLPPPLPPLSPPATDHSVGTSLRPSYHSQRGLQEDLQEIRLQTCSEVHIIAI